MNLFLRKNLATILIAMTAGAVGATAPVLAHGVIHAQFAHKAKVARNAKKLAGKPARSYMRTTGKLRLVGAASINGEPSGGNPVLDKSTGVIDDAIDEAIGVYSVYFKRDVRGLATGDSTNNELIVQVSAEDPGGNTCTWDDHDDGLSDHITVRCVDAASQFGDEEDTDFVIMVYEPAA